MVVPEIPRKKMLKHPQRKPSGWQRSVWLLAVLSFQAGGLPASMAQEGEDRKPRQAFVVRVSLPIGSQTVQQLESVLGDLAGRSSAVVRPEERPVVILEFATDRGQNGSGSRLADCMALARFLSSPEMNRLLTVAWVPRAGVAAVAPLPGDPPRIPDGLYGHAVLVAVCADAIALDQGMELGQADIDASTRADPLAIDIYRNLAGQRLTVPLPVVQSMIDPAVTLYAVRTADGEDLVDRKKLAELEATGAVTETTTLAEAGRTARYGGPLLQRIAPSCMAVDGIAGLSARYGVDLSRIESEAAGPGGALRGIRQELNGFIDSQMAQVAIRAIQKRTREQGAVNLVILSIDSPGGDTDACLELARFIAGFDPDQVRTAAWVGDEARGPAALIALACDHLLARPDSVLGGVWKPGMEPEELERWMPELERIAALKRRDPALLTAMLAPDLEVNRYRNRTTGQVRWMTPAEKEATAGSADWQVLGAAVAGDGLTAAAAEQDGILRALAGTAAEVDVYYQLETPATVLTPTKTDAFLLSFARKLASPGISVFLMFFGFSLIMTELSQPGLGLPGFLGTVCLALYFWSHYLGGSAEWFEILLFLVGLAFILIEMFVLPGFGFFGIAGILMVVVSIVLAAQTFVIPHTSEELAQLPFSLLMVVGAGSGMVGAAFAIRRFLPETPYFNRLMLKPPVPDFRAEELLASGRLPAIGARGTAVTRLIPAGKARIGGRVWDVLTEGIAVDPQQEVEVIAATGNRIVVQPVEKRGPSG